MKKSKAVRTRKADRLYADACRVIPSGVNSPVRAFRAVGGEPLFIRKGKGPFIWDEQGRRYLDFCGSWGALLFGHAPRALIQTISREIANGTSFGAATAKEVQLAERIRIFFPSVEKVRLVSSGTEAVMSAIRLARGFTGRKKILKIEGGYHGHADSLLVKAGSGGATFGIPDSAGVPAELAKLTSNIPFNDFDLLEKIFQSEGENIAAFILEPVPANMGVVLPRAGYLEKARALTRKYGALLIFDEVITGFRIAPGGAQEFFGIKPDLTCLGKILGGGLPLAAFGGRREVMDQLAPGGPVYQAGTLAGNPVAVTAALWMLDQLAENKEKKTGSISALNPRAEKFFTALKRFMTERSLPLRLNAIASMFTIFCTRNPVVDYASAKQSNTHRFAKMFHGCLDQKIYLSPSQFEANFISNAHSEENLNRGEKIFEKVFVKSAAD